MKKKNRLFAHKKLGVFDLDIFLFWIFVLDLQQMK